MTDDTKPSCEACRFLEKYAGHGRYECRRFPPSCVGGAMGTESRFPVVRVGDWCGEFKRAAEVVVGEATLHDPPKSIGPCACGHGYAEHGGGLSVFPCFVSGCPCRSFRETSTSPEPPTSLGLWSLHAVLDANTCDACRASSGSNEYSTPHPKCSSPLGCRCVNVNEKQANVENERNP